MKVVVVGGTGLVGSYVVQGLRTAGHEAVPASPSTGVDVLTGAGLAAALEGAQVVVDVTNAPSWEPDAVLRFFETSARNQAEAERAAGVHHHLAVSVVGADSLPDSGYLRAKVAQERVIETAGTPWTVLRATQFFEFAGTIVESLGDGDVVRVPTARIQPVAAQEVAQAVTELALGPAAGRVELGGPEVLTFSELAARHLAAAGDDRKVVADPHARYFGAQLEDGSLVARAGARRGRVTYAQWLPTTSRH